MNISRAEFMQIPFNFVILCLIKFLYALFCQRGTDAFAMIMMYIFQFHEKTRKGEIFQEKVDRCIFARA